ncbi:hypothetical protein FOZ60_010334 [Perkinsus olseni]|uniref:Peptidase A1 domain-containing protein n=1 Tax=Perkinsus olseni TaxID=32597 RepID=A0A7J6PDU6_PEROL|nr:hypothetical protein FOZ60_010334 [Perkinsus olseni]
MSSALRVIRAISLGMVLGSVTENPTLRLPVYYRELYDHGKHDYAIVASMKVDGQAVSPLVDTGSPLLFFIEKTYLQRTLSSESCQGFIYGCYECHTDVFKQKVTITEHCDGTCAYTVQHRSTLELGGSMPLHIDSGTSRLWLPREVFYTLWRALEKKASEASGQAIEFKVDEENRVLALSHRSHRLHLPPLELHFRDKLGGASTIVIPPEFYVQTFDRVESKTAILLWHIPEDFPNEAFLGLGLLRKYRLHFLYNDREIRFSEVTQNKDFPDIVQTARRPQGRRRAARTLETYL